MERKKHPHGRFSFKSLGYLGLGLTAGNHNDGTKTIRMFLEGLLFPENV